MNDRRASSSALDLAQSLPKAELHIHVEGTLEPEHMLALADRNGVTLPYRTVQAVRDAYRFDSLQSFLDVYYQGLRVLLTEQDFYDLTIAYLERAARDNIVHVEMFFDPQAHTERGVRFTTAIEGILAGLEAGRRNNGISSGLILCFLRHLPEASALATLHEARPYLPRLLGVGLDSSERPFAPSGFTNVFAAAGELGLHRVVHAGEEGPADYVWQALELLGAERIDHGVASIDDAALLATLAARQTPITMCPISNVRTAVTRKLSEHPLKKMLDQGLSVTINSDDPAYFHGYLVDNFAAAIDALELSKNDVVQLVRNSFTGSFLTEAEKSVWISKINLAA